MADVIIPPPEAVDVAVPAAPTADVVIPPPAVIEIVVGGGSPGGGLDQATADARYVNADGDTMTGDLVIDHDYPSLRLTSVTPTLRGLAIQTDGRNRWAFGADGGAESGVGTESDGSDFVFSRWNNDGDWIDNPMKIGRGGGVVEVGSSLWLGDATPWEDNHAASKLYVDARMRALEERIRALENPPNG